MKNSKLKKIISKRALPMLLAVMMIFGMLPLSTFADGGAAAVLTPSETTIASNGEVSIALSVSGGGSYLGLQAVVTYSAAYVEYKSVSPATGDSLVDVFEDTPGTLLIAMNSSTAIAAGDTALTLTFDGKAEGTASFVVDDVEILSTRSSTMTVSGANTSVTVEEADPADLTIKTPAQMAAFRDSVNAGNDYAGKLVRLGADIDLTEYTDWVPIGTGLYSNAEAGSETVGSHPFRGTFDGKNHTIRLAVSKVDTADAMQGSQGVFGYINHATIKNVVTDGYFRITDFAPGKTFLYLQSLGVLAGSAAYSKFENCINLADVSVTNDFSGGSIGGIVGSNRCANDDINSTDLGIYNSHNFGDITAMAWYAGGIAGIAEGNVASCSNSGAVSRTGTSAFGSTAGLIGIIQGGGTISDSFNSGDVTSVTIFVSGIANSSVNIINCYNSGKLTNARSSMKGDQVYMAGISADSHKITISNSYNIGAISFVAGGQATYIGEVGAPGNYAGNDMFPITQNCYTSASPFTAANLGAAFKADVNNINGGYPLLLWQTDTVSDDQYAVSFAVTPANATVTVYSDSARQNEVLYAGGLRAGTYFYTVEATGYITETGSFSVSRKSVQVNVSLDAAASATFSVDPADASFTLTDASGLAVVPTGSDDGIYTYTLFADSNYSYSATAPGYNGLTREFTALGGTYEVVLTPSARSDTNPTITGGQTITQGGIYNVEHTQPGMITVATDEPVTLVGTGTSKADVYSNLFIRCTLPEAKLTLQDISLAATETTSALVDFVGLGNELTIAGVNLLEYDSGYGDYATIHVGAAVELTIKGDGTLYFYKNQAGAGIGGNSGEASGRIVFDGPTIFGKGSKQGAVIGTGASDFTGTPGDIVFKSGEYTLVANARGALIGGGAGGNGAAPGGNVYIEGGTLTLNVDFSGAAIGGGGFAGGNDALGGNVYITGGSVRTFIDYNAVVPDGGASLWPGVTEAGVNDTAITATKRNGENQPVALLAFDTAALLTEPATTFVVSTDGYSYTGGLHRYKYINELLEKSEQLSINLTTSNWDALLDPNLYIYLPKEEGQTLTVNNQNFTVSWDEDAGEFSVTPVTPTEKVGAPQSGDLDGDGSTTLDEALLLVQIINNDAFAALSEGQLAAMDVNGDGYLTMADVLLVVQIVLRS